MPQVLRFVYDTNTVVGDSRFVITGIGTDIDDVKAILAAGGGLYDPNLWVSDSDGKGMNMTGPEPAFSGAVGSVNINPILPVAGGASVGVRLLTNMLSI